MTRDESILSALLAGDCSTLDLAAATGLTERVCRYGLRHLIGQDYAWSPKRGRYRLTGRGRIIASEIIPEAGPPVDSSGAAPAPSATEQPRRRPFGRQR
jgi:predicted transcriptional regulator